MPPPAPAGALNNAQTPARPQPASETVKSLRGSDEARSRGRGAAQQPSGAAADRSNAGGRPVVSEASTSAGYDGLAGRATSVEAPAPPPPPAPGTSAAAVAAKAVQAPSVAATPAAVPLAKHLAGKIAMVSRSAAQPAVTPEAQWTVNGDADAGPGSQGSVERSADGGRTWQRVPVADGVRFGVVFASGHDVWAGGEAGAFFHSSDSGQHWSAVALPAAGKGAGDIVSIQFSDAAHGMVRTSSGESWTTSDGGQTWR